MLFKLFVQRGTLLWSFMFESAIFAQFDEMFQNLGHMGANGVMLISSFNHG